jgi:hypothetical protein
MDPLPHGDSENHSELILSAPGKKYALSTAYIANWKQQKKSLKNGVFLFLSINCEKN